MSFDLAARLAARRAENLYRQRPLLESPQGPEVVVDGQPLLAFCNNDYLGLANHPQVIEAWRAGATRWGVGGGASHLVIGHSSPHHALEEALADLTGRPRALLFTTGYMANLGAVTALIGQGDTVLEDRLNHASLLDAGLLSGARFNRYLHNDAASLAKRLEKATGNTLVVTDGVFSMDGDIADLPALAREAKAKGAWLMVDDAHGFGPLGANGGGIVEHFGLSQEDVPVLVGTLGKAFGTAGAFVAGSEELIESLIQFARPYIYTTSQPPALACATLKSLELLRTEHWRREHLKTLIAPVPPRRRADRPGVDGQLHADPADHDRRCRACGSTVADAARTRSDGHCDPSTDRARRQRPTAGDPDRRAQRGAGAAIVKWTGRLFSTTGTGAKPCVIV